MPLEGREVLPYVVYGHLLHTFEGQGVVGAQVAARNLFATIMWESGGYSKKRDAENESRRRLGLELKPRYWVLYERAYNDAGNTPPSRDRGMYMLNSHWQADATDEVAYDWQKATVYAVNLYRRAGLSPWWGWKDVMSPDAMETNRNSGHRFYGEALMRWKRAWIAIANADLFSKGVPARDHISVRLIEE